MGELGGLRNVARAAMVAMMAGADFIKTSTGKEPVNATLPVTLVMLRMIRDYHERTGWRVGMKPAGGISKAGEALAYLAMLREELGQTYSPSVDADQSRTYPGYGTFDMSAQVDTGQVDAAREAMLAALETIQSAPVDEDMLLRARQPLLEAYDNALDTNSGWMGLVDRAQTEPERIDRFLNGEDMLRAITPEEIHAAALRYLDPDQRLEVQVLPQPEGADEAES